MGHKMRRLTVLALGLCAVACTSQTERSDALLRQVAGLLPGSYDNLAQARAPGGAHAALRLMVAPVSAPMVGDHVFYVQEMAADDVRRVLAQSLYVLDMPADGTAPVISQLDFTEPLRWRDGHLRRELFRGLLPQDLRLRAGCEIVFEAAAAGWRGKNNPDTCRVVSRSTGETLRAEQALELDAETFAVMDRQRDAAGTLMTGVEADPYYRYSRRADAPW